MRAYRLVKGTYAQAAFTGRGAALRGGRWNPKGYPAVYASEHLALAVLEWLAYALELPSLEGYVYFSLQVPDDLIAEVEALPVDWRALPHPSSTQDVGRAFLEGKKALALIVPSVLVPEGWNLVLNPRHPAFPEVMVEGPFPLEPDPRLRAPWQRTVG
ncbi:RES family NAD+ phosphorylase [Thermus sp. SYSU G05001]|uniref:RES family NAD+ phosphorylase n=1 Tax=Thermus brevis TaxID=2862456 RepID=A0ABS6ZXU8_9DEIN|nr:RES family NAD+ phosphorylase [Thermus brevis]MBW6394703.1 RES family NAD+ phosphorylase [Thermus brevis]